MLYTLKILLRIGIPVIALYPYYLNVKKQINLKVNMNARQRGQYSLWVLQLSIFPFPVIVGWKHRKWHAFCTCNRISIPASFFLLHYYIGRGKRRVRVKESENEMRGVSFVNLSGEIQSSFSFYLQQLNNVSILSPARYLSQYFVYCQWTPQALPYLYTNYSVSISRFQQSKAMIKLLKFHSTIFNMDKSSRNMVWKSIKSSYWRMEGIFFYFFLFMYIYVILVGRA